MVKKEFTKKEELEYIRETEKLIHEWRMEEIKVRRQAEIDAENNKFDHQGQLQRIKSAEIRRSISFKKDKDFAENYWKGGETDMVIENLFDKGEKWN